MTERWTHQFISTRALTGQDMATWKPATRIKVTAGLSHLQGNARPHFSVTAEIFRPGARDIEAGGCLHDEVIKYWPELAPIVALHLGDDTGAPMHAEANGWYWLAGALGGAGERYHGGNGSQADTSPAGCLQVFADHVRVPLAEAERIAEAVRAAMDIPLGGVAPERWDEYSADTHAVWCNREGHATWRRLCAPMLERWHEQAAAGVALLDTLTGRQPAEVVG